MDALLNSYKSSRPELPWPPSQEDESSRVIRGPLWQLEDIRAIAGAQLREGRRLVPITRDCVGDLQKLSFELNDVARLILQLNHGHYDKSMWCMATPNEGVSISPERLWYPCDAYAIARFEKLISGWQGDVSYYLKLCLNPAGRVVLLLSTHLQD